MIAGQDRAVEQFLGAWKSGAMHHAWLLAGPRGVGKASFAMAAAGRVLAEAAGPPVALRREMMANPRKAPWGKIPFLENG